MVRRVCSVTIHNVIFYEKRNYLFEFDVDSNNLKIVSKYHSMFTCICFILQGVVRKENVALGYR